MTPSQRIDVHDVGGGCTLTAYGDANQAIDDAVAAGRVFMMPKLSDGWTVPSGYHAVDCPSCGAHVMRDDRIPEDARATCTTCALKAAVAARGSAR